MIARISKGNSILAFDLKWTTPKQILRSIANAEFEITSMNMFFTTFRDALRREKYISFQALASLVDELK